MYNDPSTFGQNPSQQPNNLDTAPHTLSGWQLLAKTGIGLVVGTMIAFLLFVVLSFIGNLFTDALQQSSEFVKPNPLLPLILLFMGFIMTFVGNLIVAGLYNLFYSDKYYDSSKMFGSLLLVNGILLFIFAPIYIVFSGQIETLFLVLGFHVLFAVFVSSCAMEFLTNPNYASSALMGNVLGFAMSLLVYSIIYKATGTSDPQQKVYLLMLLPAVLGYTLTPLFLGIREKIYYKFYEMGSHAFYLPSLSEVASTDTNENKQEEETNVNIG